MLKRENERPQKILYIQRADLHLLCVNANFI